jgi:hypothetical protein
VPPQRSTPPNRDHVASAIDAQHERTAQHVARLAGAIARLPVEYLPLVIVAVEVAYRRADQEWRARAVEDYFGGRWHRQHALPAVREIDRRRYPPTGDRELWIRYGPAGPPERPPDDVELHRVPPSDIPGHHHLETTA